MNSIIKLPSINLPIEEKFKLSDYLVYREQRSKIDSKKTLQICVGQKCPKCKKVMPEIQHGETVKHACGLKMTVYGNALNCKI